MKEVKLLVSPHAVKCIINTDVASKYWIYSQFLVETKCLTIQSLL